MYEPPLRPNVTERSPTLFAYGTRLRPVRDGRFGDAASALAWLLGAAATAVHPAGLLVAALLLAVVATSIERAVASAASFGIVVVAAGAVWLTLTGALPPTGGLSPAAVLALALVGAPTAAGIVRALG
ncbi:hypothetical protein [Halolamina sp. C58]|uniref:hypothetical protein n=1 Tax=Halolamina sp. C58 TaxID=3421640 RepID=UPI003EBC99D3